MKDIPRFDGEPVGRATLTISGAPMPSSLENRLADLDRICRERIAPRAAAADRAASLPPETWRDLVESGYLRLFHPVEFGGSAADGRTVAAAMEGLARACASTFWVATISSLLCGKLLHELCGPRHHQRWLRPIVAGEAIGCFAATEAGAGSDPASYRTFVREDGSGHRLCGAKARISNATAADVAVVLARRGGPESAELCYVVVDLHAPGVRRADTDKLGLRAMSWGTLEFDEVAIDAEDVIVGASIDATLRTVEWGQLLQAMSGLGIAVAALDALRELALARHAFGRPIAHLEVIHGRLADLAVEVDAARLLVREVADTKARGRSAREAVMMAKIHATELAVRAADRAMRSAGATGYASDSPIERLYRDSLANVPAGLPNDRLRDFLGCAMVGVDPWSYPAFEWLAPAGLALAGP